MTELLNSISPWKELYYKMFMLFIFHKEPFSGGYHMYQLIPLHSSDYLKKLSSQINVATDEDNGRNEM